MTKLLASVRSAEEAKMAFAGGADIIDAKDPERGALGRLPDCVVQSIVAEIDGRKPVSATIGELPLEPDRILRAVRSMAMIGVDIIKVGMFAGDTIGTVRHLKDATDDGVRLVAVLLADRKPNFDILNDCSDAGFYGVMLDTADKQRGPLTRHIDPSVLRSFIARAHDRKLAAGLAGSLSKSDVASLIHAQPDYLGFRSALTLGGREGALDLQSLAAVRGEIDAAMHAMTVA
jgi:(5-formylfuran-3-yl)methyl phosphate synthase